MIQIKYEIAKPIIMHYINVEASMYERSSLLQKPALAVLKGVVRASEEINMWCPLTHSRRELVIALFTSYFTALIQSIALISVGKFLNN